MTPAAAYAALGLDPGASPDEIRAAYWRLARSAHPDAGGTAEAFDGLKQACNLALTDAETTPCPECKGAGWHAARTDKTWTPLLYGCSSCNGTGNKNWEIKR